MSPHMWPELQPDGTVRVALRFPVASERDADVVRKRLDNWQHWLRDTRGVRFEETLVKDPYVVLNVDSLDVVFEGRRGSKRWKDWLVSFTREMSDREPGIQGRAFVDLVGGETRPITRPPT